MTPNGKVLLAYLHPNELSASFHRSLQSLVSHDMINQQLLGTWVAARCDANGIPDGRNMAVNQLLETDLEWLFFIDADMGFAPDTLDRLYEVADSEDRPIIGGLCFAYREGGDDGLAGYRAMPRPTMFDFLIGDDGLGRFTGRNHYPVNALVQVAATGAACILIHRSVFERIAKEVGMGTWDRGVWFDRLPGADGMMGEDISFCARAGALEIPIHVHTGIRTNHHKELWVGDTHFWQSFNAPPAIERCDVIVPSVRSRIGNTERLLRSLFATTGMAAAWYVVDDAADDHAELADHLGAYVVRASGTFPVKINAAWNVIRNQSQAPWVKIVGDDVMFHPGWLDHAQHVANLYGAKVVGTNDLATGRVVRGEHATHWMIARDYIEEVGSSWDGPGVIAHEGYNHWFVDDEIVTAARRRGVFQMALGSVVEHYHPIVGKAEADDVYRNAERQGKKDQRLFLRREAQNR